MAKRLGIDPQPISKYERGVIFPIVDMMTKLAKVFGVNLDDLIYDDRKIEMNQIKN